MPTLTNICLFSCLSTALRAYTTKIANNSDEACKLIEPEFKYVLAAIDGFTIFRRRK